MTSRIISLVIAIKPAARNKTALPVIATLQLEENYPNRRLPRHNFGNMTGNRPEQKKRRRRKKRKSECLSHSTNSHVRRHYRLYGSKTLDVQVPANNTN